MTLQVQEVELCKLNVQYVAPSDKVKAAREKAIDRIKKEKVPVKGFRPGKAPSQAIELAMKPTVDSLAAKDLVAEAYNDLLFEHKIKTMFYPKVQHQSFENGSFHCEMTVWKKPEVELKQYKGFNIPKPSTESHSDVAEKMIQNLRTQHGEARPYGDGDFVQKGDKITLDIKVECEGQTVKELTQEGLVYIVGQFSDLDENLLGMVPDEKREFKISMKENSPVESVRGKVADFSVTLYMGMRTEPASLTDEFAQKIGFSSYELLQKQVNSIAMSQVRTKQQNELNNQVLSRLAEVNVVAIPSWLTELEAQNMTKNRGIELHQLPQETLVRVLAEAEKAVKLSLILDSIREAEPDAAFSERELLNSLRMKAAETGQNPDDFISNASKDGSIFGIIANMKDTATVDWVIKNSTIVD